MRCFEHIAKLIRTKRLNHPKGYSQSELSTLLGYKNGQFISNVERALCNVPLKMLGRISEVLDVSPEDLKQAILMDNDKTLDNYLFKAKEEHVTDTMTTEPEREEVVPMVARHDDYREAS